MTKFQLNNLKPLTKKNYKNIVFKMILRLIYLHLHCKNINENNNTKNFFILKNNQRNDSNKKWHLIKLKKNLN